MPQTLHELNQSLEEELRPFVDMIEADYSPANFSSSSPAAAEKAAEAAALQDFKNESGPIDLRFLHPTIVIGAFGA